MAAGGTNQRVKYTATIERIVEHNEDTRSLLLSLPERTAFRFTPGQFISVAIPLSNETRVRPYTLASSPEDDGPLEIVFNLVPGGAGSEYLFRLKVGDRLNFTGPFGLFTLDRAPEVETIFAAEGTAIAPIRPMLRRALARPSPVALKLFHAAGTRSELLYSAEFEAAANRCANFTFEPILAQPPPAWSGRCGQLLEHIQGLFVDGDQGRDRAFYLCGVGKPVIDLRDLLRKAGYARRAVQYERW
ncbi:MAG TPA: FAD-dependent oxidoreductase [Candidatus Binataceae bacterium]|nr:FAD-dependent oxidoreductase [Candidatus Binataceae bacterium]